MSRYNGFVIINVYKEKDWTSFDVVAKLRGVLNTKKVGHAGTLDPLAEGVLVILTDDDTKKQAEIMNLEKEYLAEIAFGAQSPTYDLEQRLTFVEQKVDLDKLKRDLSNALDKYIGEFDQKVPPYSAVKVEGKKLYEKARKGDVSVEKLPTKKVVVRSIQLEDLKEKEIQGNPLPVVILRITCSKGFYVRSLAHDLGRDLGVGGVLVGLTRTKVGDYTIEDAKKIDELGL